MPNRILREGILSSERVALLGWAEEVFYRRLMSVVDDFGRYHANPKLLRAALYPLLIDKVSDADIGKWLTSCVNAVLVSVYPAPDGKRYLQLLDFRQQARADKSKYPPVPDGCLASAKHVHIAGEASAPVFGVVFGDVSEGVSVVGGSTQAPIPPTPPPDFDGKNAEALNGKAVVALSLAFELPEEWGFDAEALGFKPAMVLREGEKFRQYWTAGKGSGTRRAVKGWRQTWSNWLEKAAKDAR